MTSPPPGPYHGRVSWAYTEDASGLRGHLDRLCVPRDEDELRAILSEAATQRIPLTIAGGGTGLAGGRVPLGGWVISTEKFRRLDVQSGSARVGAGVPLQDLHAAAKSAGQFYPPDPTETLAFLGGTIACNASGSRSFRYGSTRQWIERLRVVFLDGSVREFARGERIDFDAPEIRHPRSRKNSCGFPLAPGMEWVDLFCGSEGILGIVTEAEVRLLPWPKEVLNGIVFFPSEAASFDALDAWRSVEDLRMLEYVDGPALRLIATKFDGIPARAGGALIIEQTIEHESMIDDWVDRLEAFHAFAEESWFGTSDQDRERFRQFRHALPETVNALAERNGMMKLGTDYATPVEHCRAMMRVYRERMDDILPGKYVIFGHLGDAHPHVNMLPTTQEEFDRGSAASWDFARQAVAFGGTVAAEHGLGKRKAHLLAFQYNPSEIEAFRAVKRRFDPDWRLAKGTLLAEES